MKKNTKMTIQGTFVGIVTDVIDAHSFVFRSNNNVNCQVGQVVGLCVSEYTYVFANIVKIDVNFFLNNSEEYFTSIASDNKLKELSSGNRSPKHSHRILTNIIGVYHFNDFENRFIESDLSVNYYTPSIFQEVVSFDFDFIHTVYGIKQSFFLQFNIGEFLYPKYSISDGLPIVTLSPITFNCHTLISGVTGSGKSRLAALIANKLADHGANVTIVDPHNEYINFADSQMALVNLFSRKKTKIEDSSLSYTQNLSLTLDYFKPQILTKLLPGLSEQQKDYIYEVFEKINSKTGNVFKNVIEIMIEDFKFEFRIKDSKDKIQSAHEFALKDKKNDLVFYQRFLLYLSKDISNERLGRLHVIDAVLRKVLGLFDEGLFPMNNLVPIPSWLDIKKRKAINIINLDYDSNANVRRFVDTLIQCFLTAHVDASEFNRILIVDEAHLLLAEKSNKENINTANLLSRLLRESRKFGLSIIFITQNEKDVPEEIKSQFQNKFMFREEDNHKLQYLINQTCICSLSKSKMSFPMKVNTINSINNEKS